MRPLENERKMRHDADEEREREREREGRGAIAARDGVTKIGIELEINAGRWLAWEGGGR